MAGVGGAATTGPLSRPAPARGPGGQVTARARYGRREGEREEGERGRRVRRAEKRKLLRGFIESVCIHSDILTHSISSLLSLCFSLSLGGHERSGPRRRGGRAVGAWGGREGEREWREGGRRGGVYGLEEVHDSHPLPPSLFLPPSLHQNSGGASSAGILRFYTDEAPGLRVYVPSLPPSFFPSIPPYFLSCVLFPPSLSSLPPFLPALLQLSLPFMQGIQTLYIIDEHALTSPSLPPHSGPQVVLVSSLAFIGVVVLLHIWAKFTSK